MDQAVMVLVMVLVFLAFVGFVIYFIFKALQFVIQAINLYKDMVRRLDKIIELLSVGSIPRQSVDQSKTTSKPSLENSTSLPESDPFKPKEETITEFQLIEQIKKFYVSKDYKKCKYYISKLIELYPDSGYAKYAKKKYDGIKDL